MHTPPNPTAATENGVLPIDATVFGEVFPIPDDLYIPPDALQVVLQHFSGPLDLLLYLIRKQNINLLDIPIVRIAEQYNSYIELMLENNIDLASEYLVMATTLARIKSRMLLPQLSLDLEADDEVDPRKELVDRLVEYERFNQAARILAEQPRVGRDLFEPHCDLGPQTQLQAPLPKVRIEDLVKAFERALERQRQMKRYAVGVVTIDVQARVFDIYARLPTKEYANFTDLLNLEEGSMGVVVNFFSILCLWNNQAIELHQDSPGGDIYLRRSAQYTTANELHQALGDDGDLSKL